MMGPMIKKQHVTDQAKQIKKLTKRAKEPSGGFEAQKSIKSKPAKQENQIHQIHKRPNEKGLNKETPIGTIHGRESNHSFHRDSEDLRLDNT